MQQIQANKHLRQEKLTALMHALLSVAADCGLLI
jgi:hypothetical protein